MLKYVSPDQNNQAAFLPDPDRENINEIDNNNNPDQKPSRNPGARLG
jgi:hypothetical protein